MTFLVNESGRHGALTPCEQTPQSIFSIGDILEWYDDARVVVMVRDPRSVLLSQKNKWKRRKYSGGKIPLREAVRARINYHPVTISSIWKRTMSAAMPFKNNERVLFVMYETLIREPEATVQKICSHFDLEFDASMLDIPITGSSNQTDAAGSRGIDVSRAGQWEAGGLNATEINICQEICKSAMQDFGYPVSPVQRNYIALLFYYTVLPFQLVLAIFFSMKRLRHMMRIVRPGKK